MADDDLNAASSALSGISKQTAALTSGAAGFAKVMVQAFASSIASGKQFEDVLKSLALRISGMAVQGAFKPIENALSGFMPNGGSVASQKFAGGGIKPFASGGVIGTPSYFPMMDGGTGLAGEAGPEAIMPLTRGADGRLGVAGGGGGNNITVQIATPDVDSFRRSESYVTGQIARAVARGRRSL